MYCVLLRVMNRNHKNNFLYLNPLTTTSYEFLKNVYITLFTTYTKLFHWNCVNSFVHLISLSKYTIFWNCRSYGFIKFPWIANACCASIANNMKSLLIQVLLKTTAYTKISSFTTSWEHSKQWKWNPNPLLWIKWEKHTSRNGTLAFQSKKACIYLNQKAFKQTNQTCTGYIPKTTTYTSYADIS